MAISFKKAVKSQAKARIAITGPTGAGKTYTALKLASAMGQRVCVIDTEHERAALYADEFEFDHGCLTSFHPQQYIDALKAAAAGEYDVVIVDSLTHAWAGTDGALELVDRARARSQNGFAAWKDVTPLQNKLVESLLAAPFHLIVTMRSKMDYILVENSKGKQEPRKVGMAPIQRDGIEYEFDIIGDMDIDHNLVISKTRCRALDGAVINKPGADLAEKIMAWLTDGAPAQDREEGQRPESKGPVISKQEALRILALAKNNTEILTKVFNQFGFASSREVTKDAYESICAAVEKEVGA